MEGIWRTIMERVVIPGLLLAMGVFGNWVVNIDNRVRSIDQWRNETRPSELRELDLQARFERAQIQVTVEANEMHIQELRAKVDDLEDRVRELER